MSTGVPQCMRTHAVKLLQSPSNGWIYAECECGWASLEYPTREGSVNATRAANLHIDTMVSEREDLLLREAAQRARDGV